MFKKLKVRLLCLNTISIVVLMFIAFSSIYGITYQKTMRDINTLLNRVENAITLSENASFDSDKKSRSFNKPLADLASKELFFIVNLSEKNEMVSIISFFTESEEFYKKAVSIVKDKESDIVKMNDTDWAYRVMKGNEYSQLLFIDISMQLVILSKLLYTFLVVFLFMIIITFIVSNYLTNISIKPIKKAFENQNQFISDASHELKTPLAIISTNVDVLLSKNNDESSNKWLNYIHSEVKRMSKLTENLLYLSKFVNIDFKDQYEKFNLSEQLEHLILGLEVMAFERNIDFSYNIEPDITYVGHSEQLSQVMMILLDNAIKYCDSKVYVELTCLGSTINLLVKNDGEQISDKDIPKIFDRFYKVDVSRSNSSGYGLGLSIAQSIVRQHKGKLFCKSDEHETNFIVKLHL